MKKILKFVLLVLLVMTANVLVQANEITQAQTLLQQHSTNCNLGHRGWWLKLDSSASSRSESGGVYTSTGEYYGCGTCADCRSKLNFAIDASLKAKKDSCTIRGGETKSENRGTWSETVNPTNWTVSANSINIVCEKWIPCN